METAACENLKGEWCVVVGEPGAVFELAGEDRGGSPEAGIHELK